MQIGASGQTVKGNYKLPDVPSGIANSAQQWAELQIPLSNGCPTVVMARACNHLCMFTLNPVRDSRSVENNAITPSRMPSGMRPVDAFVMSHSYGHGCGGEWHFLPSDIPYGKNHATIPVWGCPKRPSLRTCSAISIKNITNYQEIAGQARNDERSQGAFKTTSLKH